MVFSTTFLVLVLLQISQKDEFCLETRLTTNFVALPTKPNFSTKNLFIKNAFFVTIFQFQLTFIAKPSNCKSRMKESLKFSFLILCNLLVQIDIFLINNCNFG
jgi:hypothetical protein